MSAELVHPVFDSYKEMYVPEAGGGRAGAMGKNYVFILAYVLKVYDI